VGLRAGLDAEGRGKFLCLLQELNPSHPVCIISCYTDRATSAPTDVLELRLNCLENCESLKLLIQALYVQFLYLEFLRCLSHFNLNEECFTGTSPYFCLTFEGAFIEEHWKHKWL
jgi:hypothetical protein